MASSKLGAVHLLTVVVVAGQVGLLWRNSLMSQFPREASGSTNVATSLKCKCNSVCQLRMRKRQKSVPPCA